MSLILLKRLRRLGKTAEITRPYDHGVPLRVLVRSISERFVHLAVLGADDNVTHQSIVRRDDIRTIRWGQESGGTPRDGENAEKVGFIHLDTLTSIVNSMDSKHLLTTLYCEYLNPTFTITGRRFLVREGLLMGEEINDLGRPCGYFGINALDITRLDFAGPNERRLENILAELT